MQSLRYGYLLLPVCLWAAAGCFPSGDSERPPGYLVIGLESNPTHLDPRYAMDADSVRIGALIFNSLLRVDAQSRFQPDLAERWEAADERTYVFDLRQGVAFHDGRPLTAADVKYTYESALDPKSRSPRKGQLQAVRAVEQTGPYRVRFRLAAPYAPFLESATLGIVPAGSKIEEHAPVGSGPFSLEKFVPGEKVVLKANTRYWEGPPAVAGVIFKIVPDAIVRILEFKKGTIDLLQNDIEPDMIPWLRKNTGASIQIDPGTIFQYIGIKLDHPILKSQQVRQAIAHAIDRDGIIRHILKGLATPATGLLSPQHWAYEASVAHLSFNPQEAKRLLDQAGFRDPDGDGPLPRFRLSYKTTTIDLRRRIAEALKEQLGRVGIELDIRSFEWGTFYGDIQKGNFHLYSLAWVGIIDPDVYFSLFHSSSVPPRGNNRGRYRNSEVDQLLEQGRKSSSLEERRLIYGRVQKILAIDLPYIPMWWTKNVVTVRRTIHGFTPYPDGNLISLKKVSFGPA